MFGLDQITQTATNILNERNKYGHCFLTRCNCMQLVGHKQYSSRRTHPSMLLARIHLNLLTITSSSVNALHIFKLTRRDHHAHYTGNKLHEMPFQAFRRTVQNHCMFRPLLGCGANYHQERFSQFGKVITGGHGKLEKLT